eukprot:TRINITY_DN22655_c0_g1_i1.p1 TRINITY_DN22655_c0_g1~~TRINITY_DN22655_c0_g1_i1.p1  ORF type:complete len:390 (+),score=50.98 TRINITY_DN22655_c0_g1_i1:115-1284(+)
MVGCVTVCRLSGETLPCEVQEGQRVHDLLQHLGVTLGHSVLQLSLAHDGRRLKSCDDALELSGASVNLVVTPVALVVTASGDGTLRVWDVMTTSCVGELRGHSDIVLSVVADFVAQRAVSGSVDETVRVWDIAAMTCLGVLKGHTDMVRCVAADFVKRRAVSGSIDETIRIWDIGGLVCLGQIHGHDSWVSALDGDFQTGRALSGDENGFLRVWNLDSLEKLCEVQGHSGAYITAVSADFRQTKHAVSGSKDGMLCVWDLDTMTRLGILEGHQRTIIAISVDFARHLAVSVSASTLCMWDLQTMTCSGHCRKDGSCDEWQTVMEYEMDKCDIFGGGDDFLSISADLRKRRVVTGHADGGLRIWDLDRWALESTLEGHPLSVNMISAYFG